MAPSGYAAPDVVLGMTIAFTSLALTTVILRLLTRLRIVKNPGLDDILITIAMIFDIGLAVCTGIEVRNGMGRPIASLSNEDLIITFKSLYASIIVYNVALCFTKFSILVQYLRIFTTSKPFAIAVRLTMTAVALYEIWSIISSIIFCWPIEAFWDHSIQNARCLSKEAVWFANAACNIVTDIAIAIIPIPVISTLQLAKRTKIVLTIVFALGGFTCVVSILRIESLYAVSTAKDQTKANGQTALWSMLEIQTGIMCSCLPTLKGLITKVMPQLFTSDTESDASTSRLGVVPAAKIMIGAKNINDYRRPSHCGSAPDSNSSTSRRRYDEFGDAVYGGQTGSRAFASNPLQEDVELGICACPPNDIRVTTTVQHEFDEPRPSHVSLDGMETASTSALVRKEAYTGDSDEKMRCSKWNRRPGQAPPGSARAEHLEPEEPKWI
ncbi:integral membrane protein [Teratosphaeria destructans]|uniref:Integral membrane protein n=1 Tax=Teratosphaeria destructans TaxID=418781 RepID=A0A9W7ST03_9PEZI|nr:integral membrane protein [Teratosphaeria destructans]